MIEALTNSTKSTTEPVVETTEEMIINQTLRKFRNTVLLMIDLKDCPNLSDYTETKKTTALELLDELKNYITNYPG